MAQTNGSSKWGALTRAIGPSPVRPAPIRPVTGVGDFGKLPSKPLPKKGVGTFKAPVRRSVQSPILRSNPIAPVSSAPMTLAPAAPALNEVDYLAGDSGYQAQAAALKRALEDYQADDTAQRTKYNTNYTEATKNLGWNNGTWNLEDANTASGRAASNQLNDFAGRGMLQSSLFATARDNLMRSLNDQLTSINSAKTDFLGDRDRELASFRNENTLTAQQARAEALARRAAGLAI